MGPSSLEPAFKVFTTPKSLCEPVSILGRSFRSDTVNGAIDRDAARKLFFQKPELVAKIRFSHYLPCEQQALGNGSCGISSLHTVARWLLPEGELVPWTNANSGDIRTAYMKALCEASVTFLARTVCDLPVSI